MDVLNQLCEELKKRVPQSGWRVAEYPLCNYAPKTTEIVCVHKNFLDFRFISIKELFSSRWASKLGDYELNIYLYPEISCYGELTKNRNPTISKHFKNIPTLEDINKLLNNQLTSYHK